MGEEKLIRALKKGKEQAYIELVNTYGNKLLKTCFLMIKDEKEAEDIVQETFIKVFKYIKSFNGKSSDKAESFYKNYMASPIRINEKQGLYQYGMSLVKGFERFTIKFNGRGGGDEFEFKNPLLWW